MDDLTGIVQEHNVRVFTEECTNESVIATLIADRIIQDEPMFVVDIGSIKRNYEKWQQLLPAVKAYFAVKSNSDEVILKVLAALGSCYDVASYDEISTVLQYVTPDRLLFAHPIKPTKTLSYARAVDVDLLTFDNSNELLKIALFHPQADLLLRLKVDDTGSACRFGTKFGAEQDDVPALLSLAKTLDLSIVGFSFHVGSGCTDPALYLKAFDQCLDALQLAKEADFHANIIDLGGGFKSETFDEFAAVIRPFVDHHPELKFVAEPGRFMVNDAATLVVSVIGKKKTVCNGETTFVIYIDESVYGVFNNITYDHRALVLEPFNEREGERFPTTVFGRTCDSIDVISERCMLPNLAIGEKLFVREMGAYSLSSASSSFNGFKSAQTVYVFTV